MNLQRVAAAWLTAFFLLAGTVLSGPALAQSKPRAAPVGEAAQASLKNVGAGSGILRRVWCKV